MKLYKIVFNPDSDAGVYAMSCVNAPAMEDVFIALSKDDQQKMQFASIDDEKRILLGAAIIPNKKIFRNVEGHKFNVVFEEETVEKLAHHYLKNGFQSNSSEDHKFAVDGCTIVESWIVEDPLNDKSQKYGKQYEKGTWVIMMKVDNDSVWEKAKQGKLNGFSIEALFGLKEVELNILNMSKEADNKEKKSVVEAIKDGFAALMSDLQLTPLNLKQMKLKDGATVEFDGETPEIGKPIFGLSKDKKEKFKLPKGKYEFKEGGEVHVDENGLVSEAPKEEKEDKDLKEAVAEMSKQTQDALKQLNAHWEAKFEQMERKFQLKLASEKEKVEELEAKLGKKPANEKLESETIKNQTELSKNAPDTVSGRLFQTIMNQN
ncbi:MAG: XkdF-like putative serine protease domain-containing protein [Bacteroidota bacterium]